MLYVGTSGYSYADWRDIFYPKTMRSKEFLAFYSQAFSCVELNFTYYRQPAAKTVANMVRGVPDDFSFTVKAHRTMTHEIPPEPALKEEFATFADGMKPAVDEGKLGCVLFQFPWSYRLTRKNLGYVLSLKDRLQWAETVVEFRNLGWAKENVWEALRGASLGFCCVDEPDIKGLFPRIAKVTSNVGYLRFHGRNAAKWYNHKEASERYDYLYNDEELNAWVPRIKEMAERAEKTYVFFNNCHRGQAAINALRLIQLVEEP